MFPPVQSPAPHLQDCLNFLFGEPLFLEKSLQGCLVVSAKVKFCLQMERTVVSSPQTANNLNIYAARLVVLSLKYTYKRVEWIEKSEVSGNLNLCSVFVAV